MINKHEKLGQAQLSRDQNGAAESRWGQGYAQMLMHTAGNRRPNSIIILQATSRLQLESFFSSPGPGD